MAAGLGTGFPSQPLFACVLCIRVLNKYFHRWGTVPVSAGPREEAPSPFWRGGSGEHGAVGLWGPAGIQCWGAHPAPTFLVAFQAGCKEGTFHLSLVMPSVAWQSRAEVMLHMAHSLFSAGNASFEILERGKVTLREPGSGGPPLCLRPGWVSICLCLALRDAQPLFSSTS